MIQCGNALDDNATCIRISPSNPLENAVTLFLLKILFDVLKLDRDVAKRSGLTSQGRRSTCEAVLQQLLEAHALPGLVLRHRQVGDVTGSYGAYRDSMIQQTMLLS